MNLLGEGFPEEIVGQVDQRQKIHGSGYAKGIPRTNEEIVYLNSNTSWCKLISSVNITDLDIIQKTSFKSIPDIDGSKLARKFVLFNGTDDSTSDYLRSGIDTTKSLSGNNNVYGIGGVDFGLRPMMGIKSANIKHENRGSLRRSTVQIKAWNKVQFDIIDTLYLRLGFNVLLEWGHSMYYNNNGDFINGSEINNSLSSEFLTGVGKVNNENKFLSYQDFLKIIDEKRKSSHGNYDAMFAKVTNFHWSFMPDGSYDITLDLVSIGDIIESFKINTLVENSSNVVSSNDEDSKGDSPPQDKSNLSSNSLINLFSNKNTMGDFFFKLKTQLNNKTTPNAQIKSLSFSEKLRFAQSFGFYYFKLDKTFVSENAISLDDIPDYGLLPTGKRDAVKIDWTGDNAEYFYYIRLGALLQFIEQKLMYLVSPSNSSDFTPNLKFDYDTESNLIYLDNLQVSTDPSICMVNRELIASGDTLKFIPDGEQFESSLGSEYGLVMNIYLNMKYILLKMDELKDDKNKLSLIDFLNGILSGINGSMGGINSLETFIDETNNTVKIIDKNPLPGINKLITSLNKDLTEKIPDKYVEFNLYGYNSKDNKAGFIKNFNFKTEISPELSTMLTVGAAANGNVVGENATALSKLNNGLTDRFKEKISYVNNSVSSTVVKDKLEEEYIEIRNKYVDIYVDYIGYLRRLNNKIYNRDEANIYKETLVNFINVKQQLNYKINEKISKQNKSTSAIFIPSTGFIPFNLSLTMDGLSGMKINSKFLVDTAYLPSNYPKNVDFLIKNLSHTIENNKWSTTLESYCISQGELVKSKVNDIDPKGQNENTPPTPLSPHQDPSTISSNGKWANKLREVISKLGYTEKGKELDSGGDISENIYKVTSLILATIKKELPTLQVKVTGGNDKYHQTLIYPSRHKRSNAIDFTIIPSTQDNLNKVTNILQRYAAGNNPNFRFIDEYRNLTSAGTANHFHISWGDGSESKKELEKSIELASQGKITPIKIS